jgi:5-methylcytosine-specific restriction endonuclease McrA
MAAQGNTTRVGLGAEHQQARKRALASMVEGTPCGYCGRPMYRHQNLHYDHVVPRALGGIGGPRRLVHQTCNLRAGQRLGVAMRVRKKRARIYTRW